ALLIDIGSTTTDIVPLNDGKPIPRGLTDFDRLRRRELVYTGVRRTPVCALLGEAVAAELFATTLDAHLALGYVTEDAADMGTADGRPATRPAAHARLARMLGADSEACTEEDTRRLAEAVHERQMSLIRTALTQVMAQLPGMPRTVVLSGSGEFLGRELLATAGEFADLRVVSLGEHLGPVISQAACAYAVAVLAAERFVERR